MATNEEWNLAQIWTFCIRRLGVPLIVSGTSFNLTNINSFSSSAAKDQRVKFYLVTKFPFFRTDDVKLILNNLLDLNGVDDFILSQISEMLQGRARLSVSFVTYFCNNRSSWSQSCSKTEELSYAFQKFKKWVIPTLKLRVYVSSHSHVDIIQSIMRVYATSQVCSDGQKLNDSLLLKDVLLPIAGNDVILNFFS